MQAKPPNLGRDTPDAGSQAGSRGHHAWDRSQGRSAASRACDHLTMVTARCLQIADAGTYAQRILREEAPEISAAVIEGRGWTQTLLTPDDVLVDEAMIARHDADPVHQERRDRFRQAILSGQELPPLIAVGPDRHLVDGYARLRAVRLFKIEDVSVIIQTSR